MGLWFVGDGFRTRTLTGVTSTGSAVLDASADTAVWSLTLTARDTTAANAAKRVAGALPKVRDYFVKAGLSEAQFTVGSLNSWSAAENGQQFTEASLSFTVRSKTVEQIAELNAKVMDLLAIAPNVNINTNPPDRKSTRLNSSHT